MNVGDLQAFICRREINEKLNRQSGFHLRSKLSSTYNDEIHHDMSVQMEKLMVSHCWDLYLGPS